jgi:hypothetical protein
MTIEQKSLWNRIDGFSLDEQGVALPFSRRLARENFWPAPVSHTERHRGYFPTACEQFPASAPESGSRNGYPERNAARSGTFWFGGASTNTIRIHASKLNAAKTGFGRIRPRGWGGLWVKLRLKLRKQHNNGQQLRRRQ